MLSQSQISALEPKRPTRSGNSRGKSDAEALEQRSVLSEARGNASIDVLRKGGY